MQDVVKWIAAFVLVALLLTETGCQTGQSIVIDAGCEIWREYGVKPSRLDTPATQAALIKVGRGMGAACETP